ncbi:hypothetical protein CC78DRAFT_618792 [Lojkania enalia]|uniref:N-acetyltransferase domain-containing protein n=1 Tax=Lojkania enalia TaxID=147567 RepID=A0A9P4N4N5_9PLEO|nr:hypothetical protein CC78DRAFT_618792 [Didymosphaeria enalia]
MSTSPQPQTHITTASGSIYQAPFTPILSSAFSTDPLTTYLLNHIPKSSRDALREHMFHLTFTCAAHSDAQFLEASVSNSTSSSNSSTKIPPSFHTCAIVVPPGHSMLTLNLPLLHTLLHGGLVSLLGRTGPKTILRVLAFESKIAAAKKKTFSKNEEYVYIYMLGTDPTHRGHGLATTILRRIKKEAEQKRKPIWLEASSSKSRALYAREGFVDVEGVYVLGKGRVGQDGEKGGKDGVRVFPMVWWPAGYVR